MLVQYQSVGDQPGSHYTQQELAAQAAQAALGTMEDTDETPPASAPASPSRSASFARNTSIGSPRTSVAQSPLADPPVKAQPSLTPSSSMNRSPAAAAAPSPRASLAAAPQSSHSPSPSYKQTAAAPAPADTGDDDPPRQASPSQHLKLNKSVELARSPSVASDVAAWGRTGKDSPVDNSHSGDGAPHSLSSGLSPRESAWGDKYGEGKGGPRARPFQLDEGLATLVHHTKQYVTSQKLRKCALALLFAVAIVVSSWRQSGCMRTVIACSSASALHAAAVLVFCSCTRHSESNGPFAFFGKLSFCSSGGSPYAARSEHQC